MQASSRCAIQAGCSLPELLPIEPVNAGWSRPYAFVKLPSHSKVGCKLHDELIVRQRTIKSHALSIPLVVSFVLSFSSGKGLPYQPGAASKWHTVQLSFLRRIVGLKQDRSKKAPISPRPRPGRPRADQAGEVERRILDAATAIFLEFGFGRATLDHVAERAHVGKTTLYSRYATKEALFEAVVRKCVDTFLQDMDTEPVRGTLEEKLVQVGTSLAEATLTPYVVSIMRITLAETDRFPEIAKEAFRLGFGACVQSIADALLKADQPLSADLALVVGKRFVELALHPLYFHAFFGDDLETLNQRVSKDVRQVARMLSTDFDKCVQRDPD